MVTTFYFSLLSDQMGRRFVFLACAIGSSVSISGFGLSTTLLVLILWFVRGLLKLTSHYYV